MNDLHADLVELDRWLDEAHEGMVADRDSQVLPRKRDSLQRQVDELQTFRERWRTHRDELLGVVEDAARYREWRRIAVTGCSDQFGDAMIAACEQQSETMVDAAIDAARHGRGE